MRNIHPCIQQKDDQRQRSTLYIQNYFLLPFFLLLPCFRQNDKSLESDGGKQVLYQRRYQRRQPQVKYIVMPLDRNSFCCDVFLDFVNMAFMDAEILYSISGKQLNSNIYHEDFIFQSNSVHFIQNNTKLTPPQTSRHYDQIPPLLFGFFNNSKNCL